MNREEEERIEVEITEADQERVEAEVKEAGQERVEAEITEVKQVERQPSLAPTSSELTTSLLTVTGDEGSDIGSAMSSATSDLKAKKAKSRKAKSGKKKEEAKRAAEAAAKAAAEAELQRQLEEDEESRASRTKTIVQKVWREYLYMVSGVDITFELIAQMNCVIFLRTHDGSVPEPRDRDPLLVNRHMSKHFEMVTIHGNGLVLLEDMLVDVYMPLLAYFEHRMTYVVSSTELVESVAPQKSADRLSSKSSDEGKVSTSTGVAFTLLRDEFLHQLHKFKTSIGVVNAHLDARVHLVVPSSLHLEDTVEDNLANIELLQQVEEVCIDWFKQVSSFL